ncbi:DUF3168 domain-containing protein [Mesorhizobium marinum]|uniref:DUF3168 domain-containing protein n=1 Tax=Mesorhizobium marinum TaxID=3228790 RepID=UPI003467119F
MIEPTLALQTAIRAKLTTTAAITALVEPDNIRAGYGRPEAMPAIVMSDGVTELHGHDYTAQRAAWVYLDLHVWSIDAGQDLAKEIAFAISGTLNKFKLQIPEGYVDHFRITRAVYPRDPDPKYGHAVLSVEALVRWIV